MKTEDIIKYQLAELDDMVRFYSEDIRRRAQGEGNVGCQYETRDGRKCAIGRRLPNKSLAQIKALSNFNTYTTFNSLIFDHRVAVIWREAAQKDAGLFVMLLRDKAGERFGIKIQNIHDCKTCGDAGGLTERGATAVRDLRERILEGAFTGIDEQSPDMKNFVETYELHTDAV